MSILDMAGVISEQANSEHLDFFFYLHWHGVFAIEGTSGSMRNVEFIQMTQLSLHYRFPKVIK